MHGPLKRDFRYSKKGWLSAWTCEDGLPLFKEEVVEYFPLAALWKRPTFATTGRLFA